MDESSPGQGRNDLPGGPALAYPVLDLKGELRHKPEDFRVSEELGFSPDGDGEHLLLRIRKTGRNTTWVASYLARLAGVRARDIGFSGMKDRHAVTEQWYSLPARQGAAIDRQDLQGTGLELLDEGLHRRKLRRGVHVANRFRIVLRAMDGRIDDLETRMNEISSRGVPNYFGPQRFGRHHGNLRMAFAMAAGRRLKRADRGYALSAARSHLFNEALSVRVSDGSWDKLLRGDVAGLSGSRSFFPVDDPDEELLERLAVHDIHPTGPMWGRGQIPSSAIARDLETTVMERFPELTRCVEDAGIDQGRRQLRVIPTEFEWQLEENVAGPSLVVAFGLPAGAFATAVLREIAQT